MFENIIETSLFVRVLIIAFVGILSINIVAAVANLCLSWYMKAKKL